MKLKYISICIGMLIFSACSSESAPDCFQKAGELVRDEVTVAEFTKITVFENVGLVLKAGATSKVEIETGAFLRNEVTAVVSDGRLLLKDTNDCNYLRPYGLTKVYVTAPNITEIRSSTGLKIESDGVLTYPSLRLLVEDFNNQESETTDGEFDLNLATDRLSIVVNGDAYFQLRGETNSLSVSIASGDTRIVADNLEAKTILFDHRGSNDILCNPSEELKGRIRSTGDVISFQRPDIVEVEEVYKGHLIFRN